MGRKNWPSWLKGGIIGAIIGLILIIIGTICLPFAGFPPRCPSTIILHLPLILLSNFLEDLFLGYIVLILLSIIISALIGFIIGKIKSLKKREN